MAVLDFKDLFLKVEKVIGLYATVSEKLKEAMAGQHG